MHPLDSAFKDITCPPSGYCPPTPLNNEFKSPLIIEEEGGGGVHRRPKYNSKLLAFYLSVSRARGGSCVT
jgi:hypothetical protein